jgi:hypothetical protein
MDGVMHVKATKIGRKLVVGMGPQLRSLIRRGKIADRKIARAAGSFDEDWGQVRSHLEALEQVAAILLQVDR